VYYETHSNHHENTIANMIRPITLHDTEAAKDIYNYYIEHTIVTFEEQQIDTEEMRNRILNHPPELPWIVFEEQKNVKGYAYAIPWKKRAAYRQSVEISVYLNHLEKGKGIGTILYKNVLQRLEQLQIHAVMCGISLPNAASIALHEKLGFNKVAHFKEVGYKFNHWIDVGYWQKILTS